MVIDTSCIRDSETRMSTTVAMCYDSGFDDFEPASELKSKTGSHKISALYFQIRNLPVELVSK